MDLLIELEKSLHQNETRQNTQLIKKWLHPKFKEVGMSGVVYDFKAIQNMLLKETTTTPSTPTEHIHSQDYECLDLDKNIKQLLYKTVIIKSDGSFSAFAIRSSIWVKTEKSWMMKYHQGTPCCEFSVIGV